MSAVLSRADFLAARKVVRWVGIGVQPEQSNGALLNEITSPFAEAVTVKIRLVAAEINLGKLPTQDVCKLADAELQWLYVQGQVEIV